MRSHSPTVSPRVAAERTPRLRPLGVGVGLFLLGLFLIAGFKTWRDLVVVERREAELQTAIAATRADIREIELRLERIADDPAVLERLAREELAMTYPDEIVVLLPAELPPARREERPPAGVSDGGARLSPVGGGRPAPADPAAPPPPARR